MYSNRRREHIHIIKQYKTNTKEYTGTRLIIFYNYKDHMKKDIIDFDNFKNHKYFNPKKKKNNTSKWNITESPFKNIIKKKMINYSLDKKYYMHHFLYESIKLDLRDYIDLILDNERLNVKDSALQNYKNNKNC